MALLVIGAVVATWVTCGAFAYARIFADFQRNWPNLAQRDYHLDWRFAALMGFFGPCSLLVSLLVCDKGLKWR